VAYDLNKLADAIIEISGGAHYVLAPTLGGPCGSVGFEPILDAFSLNFSPPRSVEPERCANSKAHPST
jgi:hypothetical protein